MNRLTRTLSAGGLAVAFLAAALAAQDKKGWEPPKPGPEHAALKALEGSWDVDGKHCLDHGDGAVSKGVETNAMICDGFWLETDHETKMGPHPFLGHGLMGYDQMRKKVVLAWAGSFSSALTLFEGSYDKASATYTLTADTPGPEGRLHSMRIVRTFKDPDHMTFALTGIGASAGGKDCT